ncbi:penicillin-binding transpeptidase domain-containing protein [Massilia sp. CFBP9012]|uniref:penicillin-binding transpeptidase domain-containing protein n=1 Tax=Massilia sp. CFBP9012 TaxID=3096531 RepID=UPI002A6A16A9|nr:penicillin-binding transpeptidase domain-containing protein [Massilia sp. CFBP9012]MDY0976278.1 penicillin-binding transpeptidase domain-containing protein [Massilia sp. CFBP9012]
MTALDQLAIRFLFASAGCLAAGLAVWGATRLARRALPALGMQRSTWLLGQAAIAATFLLLLIAPARQANMQPVFEVDVSAAAANLPVVDRAPETVAGMLAAAVDGRSPLAWLAWAWVLAYALGLAWMLGRLWRGQRTLNRLMRGGARQPGAVGPGIVEVDAPIPPMLVGPFKPRLLLPLSLRDIDPLQRELIVAHELTHWRRGDLWWLTAGAILQALCWFNPAMRLLREKLTWAQELGCDRDVLRGRPPLERRAYAAALVAQLRMQHHAHRDMSGALAFGGVTPDTLAARVELIRAPGAARHAAWARGAGLAILALAFAGNLALQPALAWSSHPTTLDCTLMLDAASGARLVEQGDCGVRATPASTFNIVVSLMGYDAGILLDAHTPALPFKKGYIDWLPAWRTTTDPTGWIRNSTVWYAQQVTSRLGVDGLQSYLQRFDYGNRDLSGGVTDAWIGSSLQISAQEQAAFLRKVVNRELGLSAQAYDTTATLLRLPTLPNGWDVYAKTGTAVLEQPAGTTEPPRSYGWFVGWAVKDGRTVVFTRLTLDRQHPQRAAGPLLKEAFLRELPSRLDAL